VEIKICKAATVYTGQIIQDVQITIEGSFPDVDRKATDPLLETAKFADNQAQVLEDALYDSLPGATYDRLLGRMLARKSSHFIVSHNFEPRRASS
jgi:hypothetical protein